MEAHTDDDAETELAEGVQDSVNVKEDLLHKRPRSILLDIAKFIVLVSAVCVSARGVKAIELKSMPESSLTLQALWYVLPVELTLLQFIVPNN